MQGEGLGGLNPPSPQPSPIRDKKQHNIFKTHFQPFKGPKYHHFPGALDAPARECLHITQECTPWSLKWLVLADIEQFCTFRFICIFFLSFRFAVGILLIIVAREVMEKGITPLIIDNTNTQAWEMKPYVSMVSWHAT